MRTIIKPHDLVRALFFTIGMRTIKLIITSMAASYIEKRLTSIGLIITDTPKTNSILNIFEPMTFPMAISVSPFRAATMLVTSSGSDVPIATMVRPMSVSSMPKGLGNNGSGVYDNITAYYNSGNTYYRVYKTL